MARKFFLVCGGLLMLVIAFTLGAQQARSQGSGSVRFVGGGSDPYISTSSGVYVALDAGWSTAKAWNQHDPPVPGDQILYYGGSKAVTTSGELFSWVGNQWVSFGFIPGGAVSVSPTTWGVVKAKYKK